MGWHDLDICVSFVVMLLGAEGKLLISLFWKRQSHCTVLRSITGHRSPISTCSLPWIQNDISKLFRTQRALMRFRAQPCCNSKYFQFTDTFKQGFTHCLPTIPLAFQKIYMVLHKMPCSFQSAARLTCTEAVESALHALWSSHSCSTSSNQLSTSPTLSSGPHIKY